MNFVFDKKGLFILTSIIKMMIILYILKILSNVDEMYGQKVDTVLAMLTKVE